MDSTGHVPSQPLSPDEARRYSGLSPFQLKDELIRWARRLLRGRRRRRTSSSTPAAATPTGSRPRRARRSSCSGSSRSQESKRVWDEPDLGGMPHADGHRRPLARVPDARATARGATLLRRALDYGVSDARLRRRRVRARAGRRDHRRQLPRARSHARARRAGRATLPRRRRCATAARRRASSTCSPSRAARRRCATCSTASWRTRILQPRRHDRARHADLHALPRDPAPRRLRASRPSRSSRREMAGRAPHLAVPRRGDRASWTIPKIKAFFLVNPSNPASFAMRRRRIEQHRRAGARRSGPT